MNCAIIIPALESNKYHKLGDLAPFGDTTLLQWKISQCKEFASSSCIFISSSSDKIEQIATKEEVGFIQRKDKLSYSDVIKDSLSQIDHDNILWTNPTAPFISSKDYKLMIGQFEKTKDTCVLSVYCKYDYVYFNKQRLNFAKTFTPREELEPIKILTNGCYIIKRDLALASGSLYTHKPYLYELDYLSAMEIKDLSSYDISQELIRKYFERELNV